MKRLSSGLRKEHADVPWNDITGMRDKLVHDYFGVDIGAVWLTAKNDVPILKARVMEILQALE